MLHIEVISFLTTIDSFREYYRWIVVNYEAFSYEIKFKNLAAIGDDGGKQANDTKLG